MFRASSAHLQKVNGVNCICMQPLASSFSAGGRLVQSLKGDSEDERMTLETCRGTQFYVIYKTVYQVGINKRIILRCTANQISRFILYCIIYIYIERRWKQLTNYMFRPLTGHQTGCKSKEKGCTTILYYIIYNIIQYIQLYTYIYNYIVLYYIYIYIYIYIQGVPGGMCQTSGGCSLC
jgi:hypothetical protein